MRFSSSEPLVALRVERECPCGRCRRSLGTRPTSNHVPPVQTHAIGKQGCKKNGKMPSTWTVDDRAQKHEARFREKVINGVLGREFLRAFDEMEAELAEDGETTITRARATEILVESYHKTLLNLGVPSGFHNNVMHLEQYDSAIGGKPPLTCRTCATTIEAHRDYACNPKHPLCHLCATRQAGQDGR